MLAGGDSAAALLLSSYRLQHFATQLLSACLPLGSVHMQQQLTEAGPWLCGAVLQRPVAWPVLRRRLTLVYWQWLLPALPNCAAYCQLLWQLRVCGGELVPPSQLLCCCSATHFGCYPKPLPKMAGGELFCFLRPVLAD